MADPHWTAYLTALMTPTVAVVGAWIALQQWITARDKLRLDLFEHRMAIYQSARSLLGSVYAQGDLQPEDERNYLVGITGAHWFFGPEVHQYLEKELWGKICDLACIKGELDGLPRGPERLELVDKKAHLRVWFLDQSERMDRLFFPYLRFKHRAISLNVMER